MKVGDYVRTTNGIICKIIDGNIDNYDIDIPFKTIEDSEDFGENLLVYNDNGWYFNDERNFKAIKENIIELLEVGDILSFKDGSICRIMEIDNDLNPPYYLLKNYGGDTYWERQEYLSDLKSILTKEQFESMEYKVGE